LMLLPIAALLLTGPVGCAEKEKPAPPAPPEVTVAAVLQQDVPIYNDWVAQLNGPVNAARVAGPPRFAVAPVRDCSLLDTWLRLLPADCSALHILTPCIARRFDSAFNAWRLATPADCSALVTVRPCWSRVTPCHGLLRVQHLELCPVHGLLRTRYLASCAAPGLL